jgi:hypothetical protein
MRDEFLLRPDLKCVCSIDQHIWPSLFVFYPQQRMVHQSAEGLIPAVLAYGSGFWTNLDYMCETLLQSNRIGVKLAIELLAPSEITAKGFPSTLLSLQPEPNRLPEGSVLLGYDVADAGLWSGLSNCGYTEDELNQIRPEWSKKINDLGLLESEEDAVAFKEISDKRVPEHAPFWVYRLHRLP